MSTVEVPASALIRSTRRRRGRRRECCGQAVAVRERAHASVSRCHRRQVDVAMVTRRSHMGQVADISRLAFDQNANVEARMGLRQYMHGTLKRSCAPPRCAGVVTTDAGAPTRSRELFIMRRLGNRNHEAARMHEGRMSPAAKYCQCRTEPARKTGFTGPIRVSRRSGPDSSLRRMWRRR